MHIKTNGRGEGGVRGVVGSNSLLITEVDDWPCGRLLIEAPAASWLHQCASQGVMYNGCFGHLILDQSDLADALAEGFAQRALDERFHDYWSTTAASQINLPCPTLSPILAFMMRWPAMQQELRALVPFLRFLRAQMPHHRPFVMGRY